MRRRKSYDGRYFWEKASRGQLLGAINDLEDKKIKQGQLSPTGEMMLSNCKKALKTRWSEKRDEKADKTYIERKKSSLGKNQLRLLKMIREIGYYDSTMGNKPFACSSVFGSAFTSCIRQGLISAQTFEGQPQRYIMTMDGSGLLNMYVGTPSE